MTRFNIICKTEDDEAVFSASILAEKKDMDNLWKYIQMIGTDEDVSKND